MTAGDGWDAEKMLDLYLHDYFMKKNMRETAELFRKEARISNHSVVIDSPQGFLQEWWSLFYDVYASRQPKHQEHSEAETSAKAEKLEHQSLNYHPEMPPSMIIQQRPIVQVLVPRDFGSSFQLLETNQLRLPNSVAASLSLQQQQINLAQHQVKREHSQGISLGRTIPVNPLIPYGAQKGILPAAGPDAAGLNDSINLAPLNGWPLDASNYQQQLQILKPQPEISAQGLSPMRRSLTPSFPGSSSKFNYCNLILPKSELNGNNRQMVIQTLQTEEQNQHNMLQQQQPSRKRKTISLSRMQDKKLDCIRAEENKSVDDTVESFLSHNEENVDNTSTTVRVLKHCSNPSNKNEHRGLTFGEVSCLHSSKSKVLSCHFSSDGKLLASAGHEKKVFIWNTETFDFMRTSESHSLLITEVRFRPSSTIFATSSFDKTVQIWDSAKPSKSLFKLVGHAEQVLSLDFHPRKSNLLCSCDSNNEMRFWNVNQRSCMHVSKGATKQVRFQPQLGKLIATASGNVVNVIDVETDEPQFCLKGHNKKVLSICWDPSGKYIASISEDSARIWSISSGECIHELRSTGNKFQSCTFHPGYSLLLVIGGYQCLELWNPLESNKTWTVEAHRGLIPSLADSLQTEMVASASHDQCVKLWK